MAHNVSLITTLAAGFGLALLFGFVAERLRMPALVGYLLAGIVIGPSTPGFIADVEIAAQLSEIGVMLLMFGVGLHFSLGDLLAVRGIVIPGALVQMAAGTALGTAMASWWGWSLGAGLVLGLAMSCASTVAVLKALEARGLLDTMNGRIAVGWLVVEDLITVLVLVLLPPLAAVLTSTGGAGGAGAPLWQALGKTLLQVTAFVVVMVVVGRRLLPWIMWQIARTGSRELFTLSVVAAALGIAFGAAQLFGVSFALGAFVAGMVLRESEFSHRAAEESLPLRDAFAVLFFVGVGMLFDPGIVLEQPMHLLDVTAVVMLANPVIAIMTVLLFRYRLRTALTVGASLAQIGEFSFILAGLGLALGLLPREGQSLILAAALISIALNPFMFAAVAPARDWILRNSGRARELERRPDPLAELPMSTERRFLEGQVVLVGYGRVGRGIAEALREKGIPYVVAEQNRERVGELRAQGVPAVAGDATDPAVLIQAHIAKAAMLVVTTPDTLNARKMVETARVLNPGIEVVLRTHSQDESELLRRDRIGTVFFGDEELARGMVQHVLSRFARPASAGRVRHG